MKTMAEVLEEHQLGATWEDGECQGITCFCGLDIPLESLLGEIDMQFLAAHQAAALSAAGFGPAREAQARALRDAAGGLRDWYQERMDEEPAVLDIELSEYELGKEIGVTEGILAASLKVRAAAIEANP